MLLAQCSVSVTTAISIKWELMRFKVLHVKKSTNQESFFFFILTLEVISVETSSLPQPQLCMETL